MNETDWANPAMWGKDRSGVFDPTCGSGTLLVAWGEAIKRRAKADSAGEADLEELHAQLVSETLMGLDINAVSLQLAGSQLTLGDPRVQYDHMNLWEMPYGWEGSGNQHAPANAGTLEVLADKRIAGGRGEPRQRGLELGPDDRMYKAADGTTRLALREDEPRRAAGDLDRVVKKLLGRRAAIMNPPFVTRDKLGEKLGPEQQMAVRRRTDGLQALLEAGSPRLEGICGKTTTRPLYVGLGLNCINAGNEVFATVIPTVGLLSPSGLKERRILAAELHIRQVVSFHEPGFVNASQKTAANESLVIGTREGRDAGRPTTFVSFERRPRSAEEARAACVAIAREEIPDSAHVRQVSAERMRAGEWSAAGWCANELDEAIEEMESWPELVRFADVPGVTMQAPGDGSYVNGAGPGKPRRLLNQKGGEGQTRLLGAPDSTMRLKARRGRNEAERSAHEEALWEKQVREYGAHLFLTTGQDPASGRVCAVACLNLEVGSKWKGVQGLGIKQAKAAAVWMNSTLGRAQLLTHRGGDRLGWPNYNPKGLKEIRIPKPERADLINALAAAFDKRCEELVPRFNEGYGPLRQAWDEAVVKVIPSADAAKVRAWAELLAEEPVCTGRAKGSP